jgi:eukaryotic translation initiation factor 2C
MELCKVPPGQLVRKEMSPDQIRHILGFSGLPPRHREGRILDGLAVVFDCTLPMSGVLIMCYQVLQYGQSQYVQQFGMDVPNPPRLVELDGRIISAPRLNYNPASKKPFVVCTFPLL